MKIVYGCSPIIESHIISFSLGYIRITICTICKSTCFSLRLQWFPTSPTETKRRRRKLTKGENVKKAITIFQQHNFRVVQLEFDKWRPLSKMIPNNLLQHPMSGKPTWLPGYMLFILWKGFFPWTTWNSSTTALFIHTSVTALCCGVQHLGADSASLKLAQINALEI